MEPANRKDQQIISYLTLRRLIGLAGIALPILLAVGYIIKGDNVEILNSISDYYHSEVRDLFVGVLFVLGFFLLSYKGYEKKDSIVANLGCLFSLGVALSPCQSEIGFVRTMHFICAILLFGVFIYFCLVLFPKGKEMFHRNKLYRICGWGIVVCLVLIALSYKFLSGEQRGRLNPVFWLESIALWLFGLSWLIKGRVFWKEAQQTT